MPRVVILFDLVAFRLLVLFLLFFFFFCGKVTCTVCFTETGINVLRSLQDMPDALINVLSEARHRHFQSVQ